MRTICDGVGPRVLLGLGLINLYANSVTADPVTRYVGSLGAHISPFTSWANAATDIQSAVDVAEAGDTVLVSNGVYATGTRLAPGGQLPNRVVVTNNILIASLAGPAETIIVGQGPNGTNAVRCAFVTNGVLRGFTLRGGYTRTSAVAMDSSGGGIYGGRIEDSQIFNCSGVESGGGAYNAELSNCLLANNTARSGGGAEQSTLSACVVISNYATYTGGGVRESTLFNCNVSSNRSDGDGGGVLYGTLIGCRLEGNVASNSGGGVAGGTLNDCVLEGNQAQFGGGAAWGTLHNSRLANNSADSRGGGASGSTLYNSYLFGNRAETGGGASYCELMNCTVTMNEATGWHGGGGVEVTILVNCIVLHNFGNGQPNVNGDDDIAYSCTDRLLYGPGNIADDPQLLSPSHLSSTSPCFGAGSPAYTNGVDIDGDPWRQLPSMGCDERPIGLQTGALRVKIVTPNTTFAEGWTQRFMADIEGPVTRTTWSFGDDNSARNQYVVPHAWTNAGMYNVVLTAYSDNYPNGVSATTQVTVISAQMSARYVRPPGPGGGTYPYDSWATAARSIQQAVDAQSVIGGRVWVTNGVYLGSSRMMPGHLVPNRLVLTNGAWVVSVNGPTKTTIVGGSPAAGTRGGIRGVYVGGLGGILEGFTISNGYANVVSFNTPNERGGGIFVAGDPPGHLITNCVIRNCTATNEGGGLFSGRAQSCVLVDNSANTGGGASSLSDFGCARLRRASLRPPGC